MRRLAFVFAALLVGCGSQNNGEGPVCQSVTASDFQRDSGWGASDYCDVPTDLGCFPYHAGSDDTCGPFVSMRTTENTAEQIDACEALITNLNCGRYTNDDGTTLEFFVEDNASDLATRVVGTYQGQEVDTNFYFNPCHQNCQAAITLETIEPEQQKLCEIPQQGKPVCLFDDTAHSVTFVRADDTSMVIRTAGEETALSRILDE
jgi:hypothetical protein